LEGANGFEPPKILKAAKAMATKKQRSANRRNAKKSTGPKTPEGKAVSCMNRLSDGLYSSALILPGENRAHFEAILRQNRDLYQPQDASHHQLVDQLTATQWRMLRVELIEAGTLIQYGDAPASDCLGPYERVMRMHGRLSRLWFKLYKELQAIKEAHAQEVLAKKPCAIPQKKPGVWLNSAKTPGPQQLSSPGRRVASSPAQTSTPSVDVGEPRSPVRSPTACCKQPGEMAETCHWPYLPIELNNSK
jgi:hypothetical protein